MATKIQLRRGTSSEWSVNNPILASGEPGVETDTGKFKLGDGTTTWNALTYAGGDGSGDMTKAVYDSNDNGIVDHAALADAAPWAGVTGKPATFSPSAHSHAISEVTALQAALDGKAALAHGHAISDVTSLQSALDGKAALTHTHAIADTTGLQAALDGKQPLDADLTAIAALTTTGFAIRTAANTWQARDLLASDIPDLDAAKITSGTIDLARISGLTDAQIASGAAIAISKLANINTARFLGRSTAGAGAIEEISIGSGLSLSAGTLSATGGGGTPGGADGELQFNNAGAFGGLTGVSWDSTARYLASQQSLNSNAGISVTNDSAGAAASAESVLSSGGYFVNLSQFGTGYTSSGLKRQGGGYLESAGPGGLTLAATDSSNGNLYLATGGTATTNRRITIAPTGGVTINAPVSFQKATASQVVTLTDAANISTDAALGNRFRVTLAGNRTLAPPTNPTADQQCVWEFVQDGTGSRTITLDTGTGGFAFGTDITAITLTTAANKRDFMTATYNATLNKWLVIGFIRGY